MIIRRLLVVLACCIVGVAGCGTQTGTPGPQGEQGPPGEQGEQGPPGDPGADGAAGDSVFSLSGSDAFYDGGNVGVGTNAPDQKLHVVGNAKVEGTVFADAFSSNSPLLLQTGGTTRVTVREEDGFVGVGGTTDQARFYMEGDETAMRLMMKSTSADANRSMSVRMENGNAGGVAEWFYDNATNSVTLMPIGAGNVLKLNNASGSGITLAANTNVGVHTTSPNATLEVNGTFLCDDDATVNGDLTVVGNLCAGSVGCPSDARLKKNVQPLSNAIELVERLRGVWFDWNDRHCAPPADFDDHNAGFIAQEIRDVLPSAVMRGPDGYLAVDYAKVTPVLVEAVKELHAKVSDRDARIAELEQRLSALEHAVNTDGKPHGRIAE